MRKTGLNANRISFEIIEVSPGFAPAMDRLADADRWTIQRAAERFCWPDAAPGAKPALAQTLTALAALMTLAARQADQQAAEIERLREELLHAQSRNQEALAALEGAHEALLKFRGDPLGAAARPRDE